MPTPHPIRFSCRLLVISLSPVLALFANSAHAAAYYWDIDGATPGAGGATPSGDWGNLGPNWSAGAAGTIVTLPTTTSTGDGLTFAAGGTADGYYTVTLIGAQNAGTITIEEGAPTLTGGDLNLAPNATLTTTSTVGIATVGPTIASRITGAAAGLTIAGPGTLTLTGANTYAGLTNLSAGTLQIGNGGATGTLGSGDVANTAILAFNRSDSGYVVSNVIYGAGAVSQVGSGTTTLIGANSYAGPTTVSAGTLNVLGSLTSNITVASGATLSGQSGTTSLTLALATGSSIVGVAQTAGAGNMFRAGGGVTTTGTITIVGNDGISGLGAHNLDVVGYGITPGIADFSTANYHAGAAVVDDVVNKKITLSYTSEARTWNAASSTWDNMTTAAWQEGDQKFSSGDQVTFDDTGTGGGGARSVTLNQLVAPDAVLFNNASSPYTVSGTGSISGTTDLTKNGTGTVILATSNTYSGATTINAGVLLVNATHTASAGAYSVASGGTLGGTGTITTTGAIALAAGGQITGGDLGTLGTLTLAGAGSRTLGGTYLFDVDYGTQTGDVLAISGASSVDLAGGTFQLGTAIGAAPAAGSHYAIKLFDSDLAVIGTPAGQSNYAGTTSGLAADQSIVTWDGGKSYYLVPEPGSFVLLGLGCLLLLRRPSRRRTVFKRKFPAEKIK